MKKARNETAGHINSSLTLCAGAVWMLEDSPVGSCLHGWALVSRAIWAELEGKDLLE